MLEIVTPVVTVLNSINNRFRVFIQHASDDLWYFSIIKM